MLDNSRAGWLDGAGKYPAIAVTDPLQDASEFTMPDGSSGNKFESFHNYVDTDSADGDAEPRPYLVYYTVTETVAGEQKRVIVVVAWYSVKRNRLENIFLESQVSR